MRRRSLLAWASGWVIASACASATAQIFECPVGDGFAFQQSPCPGLGASGGRLVVFANGRPAPLPEPAAASAVPRVGRSLGRTELPARKSK